MNPRTLTQGIADVKKAELDAITAQVTQAQFTVAENQAIVNSLTSKSRQYNTYLTTAEGNQATALANLNLVNDAVAGAKTLFANTKQASKQTTTASKSMSDIAGNMALLIDKLVFTGELIDKLSQIINKQKSINPLIPDSLISFISKAGTDAANAMALTLTALQSCYAAEATLMEAEASMSSSNTQANELVGRMELDAATLTSGASSRTLTCGLTSTCAGIQALLQQAYKSAKESYEAALWNNSSVAAQLDFANAALAQANTDLASYQAGLAAAKAAAYAS